MSSYDPWYEFFKNLTGAGDAQWKWIADAFGMSQEDIDGAQNAWRWSMSEIPLLGWTYKYMDAVRSMEDYLKWTRQTWGDMKYPTRAQGSGVFSSGINFISRSALRLYDDDMKEIERHRRERLRQEIWWREYRHAYRHPYRY